MNFFRVETFAWTIKWDIIQLFTTQAQLLMTLKKKALENSVEKGENAGNQHFVLFPQCFLLYQREKSSF